MKNILTIVATAFITMGVMIGGNAIINGNGDTEGKERGSRFTNMFTFGGDTRSDNKEVEELFNELSKQGDIVLCPENQSPEFNALTGEIECITAEPIITDCVRPVDGEAYPDGDTKIGYKSAIKDNNNLNPECDQITFTCKEGKYQSNQGELEVYNRGECIVIDKTNEELKTCEYNGQEYNMGEEIYTHIKDKVQSDSVCRYAKFKCAASDDLESQKGEWYSAFDLNIYEHESCEVSEALSDEYIKENIELLLEEGRVIENEDEDGNIVIIQNTNYKPQSLGNEKSCTAFDKTYKHNESKRFFEYKTTAYTKTCNYVSSTCVDGNRQPYSPENFDGIKYPHTTCKIEGPGTCTIGSTIITDTKSGIFYDYGKKNVTTGERECENQLKYCDAPLDGEGTTRYDSISGATAANKKYIYTSCKERKDYVPPAVNTAPAKPYDARNAACPNPYIGESATWKSGQTGIGYDVSSVAYGSSDSCQAHAINLVCIYGAVRAGNTTNYSKTTYTNNLYRNCSEGNPNSCTFDYLDVADISVPHTGTATFYTVASVKYGDSCSNYLRSNGSLCTNGSLSVASGYKNCVEGQPAACTSPCGTVANGSSITTYNSSSLPFAKNISSCDQISNMKVVSTCNNGRFDVTPGRSCSCSIAAPLDCNGQAHGTTITRKVNYDCQDVEVGDNLNGQADRVCQCFHGSRTCYNGQTSDTSNRSRVQGATSQPGSC